MYAVSRWATGSPDVHFNFQSPAYVSLEEILPRIEDGWIAQFRGAGRVSQLIRMVGGASPHTHSAMLHRTRQGIDLLEVREGIGGRNKPLEWHAVQSPGQIDLFSPNADNRWPQFSGAGACDYMRRLTKRNYGYGGIVSVALRHMPFLWRTVPVTTLDAVSESEATSMRPFCSHAVSLATDQGGGVDVVPRLPHWLVEPSHLTRSMFYAYEGTIAKPKDQAEARRWSNL